MKVLSHTDVLNAARGVARRVKGDDMRTERGQIALYGVPRGGVPAMYLVGQFLGNDYFVVYTADLNEADVIIDDVIDSGVTRERHALTHPYKKFYALYTRPPEWVQFPWELSADGKVDESATDIPRRLLQYIGENVGREGLADTPQRFLKAWKEYTSGYAQDAKEVLKTFEDGAQKVDEMVLVKRIPVYSLCEHHLAAMFGWAHVAYIPNGRVLGLSKFARLVDVYARRLQVQERLTQQIAHALNDALQAKGVAVMLELRHMCMEARGVRALGTSTTTSCLLGAIKTDASARSEFLSMVRS